jgi:arylsulfatase A-like enzyme
MHGSMRTQVLRPILPVLGGVALGALLVALRGWGLQEVRWTHLWAGLQLLHLPFSLLAGLLLGLLGGRAAPSRLRWGGFLLGAGLVLAQEAAFLALPPAAVYGVGLGLLALLQFSAIAWVRRAPAREVSPAALRVVRLATLLTWSLPLGLLVPGKAPALGAVPPVADDPRPVPAADAPNLVLLVLDTLRADHLGCYGYARPTSPNLDALAARGQIYRQAQSVATHTSASHATLFTGLLPSEHGVTSPLVGLRGAEPTLAGALADAGWNTAGVTSNYVVRRQSGFGRGFHYYDDTLVVPSGLATAIAWINGGTGVGAVTGRVPVFVRFGVAKVVRAALRDKVNIHAAMTHERAALALDRLEAAERPYFLFVNYMDVHAPYDPPPAERARFLEHDAGRFRSGLDTNVFQNMLQALEAKVLAGEQHDETIAALVDLYDGELAHLDSQLPLLWDRVFERSRAQGRDTLLVIVSDHGEMFAEHGRMTHAQELHEECLHVPLILAGSLAAQGVVEETVSVLDLPATLLAAAGLPPIGRSQDLRGGAARPPGHVIAEDGRALTVAHFDRLNAIAYYAGRLKGVFGVDEDRQQFIHQSTFDLAQDPGEHAPQGVEPLRALLAWQSEWWERYLRGRAQYTGGGLSAQERAALAALGYVEGAGGD